MTRNTRTISAALKQQIITESFKKGCVVSKLAGTYDISKKTLYRWRKIYKAQGKGSKAESKFIELLIEKTESYPSGLLKKVELTLEEFSISLEGKISGGKLLAIIKALGISC